MAWSAATLMLPSATGGANWQGGAFDPETKMFYIFTNTSITPLGLVKPIRPGRTSTGCRAPRAIRRQCPAPAQRAADAVRLRTLRRQAPPPEQTPPGGRRRPAPRHLQRPALLSRHRRRLHRAAAAEARVAAAKAGRNLSVQGLPLVKPPYGRITALDMNKGTLAWQIAHGDTPDNIRNHPALKGVSIPRTGRQGRIGVLVTKTLLIAGEGGFATQANGQRGALLRAYDKATGTDVGAVYMPAPQTGSPMTYMWNGKQYIVVAISGGNYAGELLAFKLP